MNCPNCYEPIKFITTPQGKMVPVEINHLSAGAIEDFKARRMTDVNFVLDEAGNAVLPTDDIKPGVKLFIPHINFVRCTL